MSMNCDFVKDRNFCSLLPTSLNKQLSLLQLVQVALIKTCYKKTKAKIEAFTVISFPVFSISEDF